MQGYQEVPFTNIACQAPNSPRQLRANQTNKHYAPCRIEGLYVLHSSFKTSKFTVQSEPLVRYVTQNSELPY